MKTNSQIIIGSKLFEWERGVLQVKKAPITPFIQSRIYINGTVYIKPTPLSKKIPVTHDEKVELYTWRGSLTPRDQMNFDILAENYVLGVKLIDHMEEIGEKGKFCQMLKLAHRLRGYC